MQKPTALIPLAEGFEEVEAVTIVDLLRRAGVDVTTAQIGDGEMVTGAHGIALKADKRIEDVKGKTYSAVILPGGMPGTTNLAESPAVEALLKAHDAQGAILGAICAAPTVLARYGLLDGKQATCYPGFEDKLAGARTRESPVVEDGRILTSRGPGTAVPFALKMIERLCGPETSAEIRKQIVS